MGKAEEVPETASDRFNKVMSEWERVCLAVAGKEFKKTADDSNKKCCRHFEHKTFRYCPNCGEKLC